jgi:hypothetical protein
MLTETIGAITGNNIPEDEANKIKSVFEKIFSGNQGNDIMGSIGKQLNQSSTNGQMNNPGDILKNVLGNGELIKSLSNIRQVVDNSVEEVTKKDENNLQAAQAAAQSTNLR